MTDQIGSGTAQGLIEYLDQLVAKGRANSGSIVPLKSTLRQVLSRVDGEENWKNTDIRNIDSEDYIARFKNLTIGKYNAESYVVYLSRLNKVIDWYKNFLINPGWAPTIKVTAKTPKKQKEPLKENSTIGADVPVQQSENSEQVRQPNNMSNDLVTYPFPLRAGKMVYLYLPVDITSAEANRLSKYLMSLSLDENSS